MSHISIDRTDQTTALMNQTVEGEWVTLPGGELEGRRPRVLCGPCRLRKAAGAAPRAICFECFRAERRRQEAIGAAAQFDTASDERFQFGLPFEPVNRLRLDRLKAERAEARQQMSVGVHRFEHKRRHAQIAARHALQRLGAGLEMRGLHAAELQLPEAWLPFVASR
jgi:hypothetical protein